MLTARNLAVLLRIPQGFLPIVWPSWQMKLDLLSMRGLDFQKFLESPRLLGLLTLLGQVSVGVAVGVGVGVGVPVGVRVASRA